MTDSEKLDLILSEMQEIKRRTTNIELHLENVTDKNVQLIAENLLNLQTSLTRQYQPPTKISLMK